MPHLTEDALKEYARTALSFLIENREALIEDGQLVKAALSDHTEIDIELRTSCPTMKVWAVSAEGFYIGALPTTYEDGVLRFTVGKSFPTMYYHIREE